MQFCNKEISSFGIIRHSQNKKSGVGEQTATVSDGEWSESSDDEQVLLIFRYYTVV
jgi:hypothetical protein